MEAIRTARVEDSDTVAEVLGDSFTDDPVMAWAFPELESRPRLLEQMFGFMAARLYLPLEQSSVLGDVAAALWLPAGVSVDDAFWVEHGEEFVGLLEGRTDRLFSLSAAMDEHHPGEPHRYLLAIGVRTSAQGGGLGGQLLAAALAAADAAGDAAYLEATSPRSRVLYERHGFEVTDEFSADGSPPLWPMWRAPR